MPHVSYTLRLDGEAVAVRDVHGLPGEEQIAEYRHGNSPVFYPIKMPGLGKVGNVVVDDVTVSAHSPLGRWSASADGARDVTISVKDETGVERVVWTLRGARPGRPAAAGAGGALRLEHLQIACDGIEVANA